VQEIRDALYLAERNPQKHHEWLSYLLSELDKKDHILQQSRQSMIAALKHIDGTAKLFSHRTKSVVIHQLSEALKMLNHPLTDEKQATPEEDRDQQK
jgi:hypothetical protein